MYCPKCRNIMVCGCVSCLWARKPGDVPYTWKGDNISCGYCGHTKHCDAWLDEEFKQEKLMRKKK